MRIRLAVLALAAYLTSCDTVAPTYPPRYAEVVALDSIRIPIADSVIVVDPDVPPIYAP